MTTDSLEKEKKLAAKRSLEWIESSMKVGLGTGSTSFYMIQGLGALVANGLSVKAVPSSEATARLAQNAGIPMITLAEAGSLDIYIDGADEFDDRFQLIKGGGGALLREKILAYNSKLNIIITDSTKQVSKLGSFKLPVEIIPFAETQILHQLSEMGLEPVLREKEGTVFITDQKNHIVDIDISGVTDVTALNKALLEIPGVVETGIFLNLADIVIVGKKSDTLVLKNPNRSQ